VEGFEIGLNPRGTAGIRARDRQRYRPLGQNESPFPLGILRVCRSLCRPDLPITDDRAAPRRVLAAGLVQV
jgi:hypothetical protein